MNVSEAVATRRAVRAFSPQPVPLEILRSVLDKARMAPSGCNYQPWEAVVLTGEPLLAVQTAVWAATPQDDPEYVIHPPALPAHYKGRLEEAMRPLYQSIGIERSDAAARKAFTDRNRHGFGAPALLLCFIPRCMGHPQWADLGIWLQTVMLLLREAGLDSCAQGYLSYFARLIKSCVGIDDASQTLFCGLAIGYRDADNPLNLSARSRVALDQQIKFLGF